MGKRLILTVHKNQYYTASAMILRGVKEADIEFTAADGIHDDLLKYLGKDYENIYIIGSRLKADYAVQLKDAITALEKEKVAVTFYLIGDRIEIKSPEVKFFMPYIKEAREGIDGAMITDLIKKDFEIPEADFQRINEIYKSFELKKYTSKDPQAEGRRKFVEYTYQMYFKWDVGDTSGLVDMIKKTAFDSATPEEINRAKKYETSEYMLTGDSKALAIIRKKAKIVGGFETPVLIVGETGTGKEFLARMVSEASKRRQDKFVAVNCAAINHDLMESTLFGHEKGAFTGADKSREGVIKQAEGGTLFLDEITEMPLEIQSKLLRFLQDFQYWPLGFDGKAHSADVRVIAATNANIKKMIKERKFREDLYYRLSGVTLRLPPLRERKEDIKQLAVSITYNLKQKEQVKDFTLGKKDFETLESYDWPGNVRQLHKFIYRCIIFDATGEDLKKLLDEERCEDMELAPVREIGCDDTTITTIAQAEEAAIRKALRIFKGKKKKAAEAIGMVLNTLKKKMKDYDIKDETAGDEE